jgi:hypothetical protein
MVLSHDYWQRASSGDPGVVARPDGGPQEVHGVGVAAAGFTHAVGVEVTDLLGADDHCTAI